MHNPPRILIVDDNETNRDILRTRLDPHGYELLEAADGEAAIAAARTHHPDLILLDVMMPKIDGIEVCRRIKSDADLPFIAIILVTAKADTKDVVAGLEAGADEYLTKPVDQAALVARVKSMLRMKDLTDRVGEQAADLAKWNKTLEERVQEQVTKIERLGRLKRFLPPQVAELILTSGDDRVLDSHRREVTVLFCDLRGFTAFSETSEPEGTSCANITRRSAPSFTNSRERSNISQATASWRCSMIPCPVRSRVCRRCGWRRKCAWPSAR